MSFRQAGTTHIAKILFYVCCFFFLKKKIDHEVFKTTFYQSLMRIRYKLYNIQQHYLVQLNQDPNFPFLSTTIGRKPGFPIIPRKLLIFQEYFLDTDDSRPDIYSLASSHLPAASFYSELFCKLGNSVLKSNLSTTAGKTCFSPFSIYSFSIKTRNLVLQMRFNIFQF